MYAKHTQSLSAGQRIKERERIGVKKSCIKSRDFSTLHDVFMFVCGCKIDCISLSLGCWGVENSHILDGPILELDCS